LDPRRYNGKSPIDEYLAQFEVIARHNQWDKYEQAAALLSALDGTACSIINELDDVASATYVTVREALIRRFGATKRTDVHERALDDIKMKKDDDIKQTAQEIVKLTRRAYPELTASQRERFAIKALISAIDDSDTAFYIKDKEPATINDVCDLYEKYETLCRGHRRRRPANVNKCQSPTRHSSSTEQAEQPDNVEKWMKETNGKIQLLTESMTKLVSREAERTTTYNKQPEPVQPTTVNNTVPKKPCPKCGGPHWARVCPSNSNQPRSTSACYGCGGEGHQWRQCPSGNSTRPTSAPDRRSPAMQGQ
jgi:hypothetical protein